VTPYCVIFIDLQGASREPARRDLLQQQLTALRDLLNAHFDAYLAVSFQIVWGDELKGILTTPVPIWNMYQVVHKCMTGTPFYFAVGLGTIDTVFDGRQEADINALDGTAFKAARKAMDALKAQSNGAYLLRFATPGNARYCTALNAFVSVMNDLIAHMTPSQRRHFTSEYPWHQPVPEYHPISRQAVWETLQRARIDAYRAASEGLQALLSVGWECPELVLPNREVND
jgi:hypothetical protein